VPMVQKMCRTNGVGADRHAVLVLAGWLFFIIGQIIPELFLKLALLAVARVLPYESFYA